ncbi:MAG: MotA/TolQ/ExbB proton channel family protein [Kiritimatiellae bacterium]|nr:MotA/TolQ/ExbB proton channel family protein [Kiritimatiellia bacterium]
MARGRFARWQVWAAWMAVAGAATACLAQAEPAASEPVRQTMTLTEIIQTGGWLMYVLGALSVVGLAFVVYFLVVLQQERIVPRQLVNDLRQMISAGQLDAARAVCARDESPCAAVAAVALGYVDRIGATDATLVKEMMEGEGGRQAGRIQSQTQYLLDIGVISPMIGLLGTVMGMLKAFNAVALDIAKAKPMVLAAGVSQALITTAAGLIVGIPAMIFYFYFRGRTAKLISNLEAVSAEILALLVKRDQEQHSDKPA